MLSFIICPAQSKTSNPCFTLKQNLYYSQSASRLSAYNAQFWVHDANLRFAYQVLQAKLAGLFHNDLSTEADSLASVF